MNEIEKKAQELAVTAVRARMARHSVPMEKSAEGLSAGRVLGYGAGGAALGAGAAGLASYLAKRKKERMLRDVLLGGLVGGVGGASIPLLQSAPGDIEKALGGDKTPEERRLGAETAGRKGIKDVLGSGGKGSPMRTGLSTVTGAAKELLSSGVDPLKTWKWRAGGFVPGYAGTVYNQWTSQPGYTRKQRFLGAKPLAAGVATALISGLLSRLGE